MSRRRLPAPPLILQPILFRVRQDSVRAARLLELADFLSQRGLLTDGGALSLAGGLNGRGGVLSLTSQDVRASAHGLTLNLLAESQPSRWAEIAEAYYKRYDRGKPRRPTRLQRLFVEWSPDLGPVGLIEICLSHPRLWEAVRQGLAFPASKDDDRLLLEVALAVRDSQSWQPWLEAFARTPRLHSALLQALPLLPHPSQEIRLAWLAAQSASPGVGEELAGELFLATRRRPGEPPIPMLSTLVELGLRVASSVPGEVDPRWLGLLRSYCWPSQALAKLRDCISLDDPVRRIVYGPRPGRPWIEQLWNDLETQAIG